MSKVTSNLQGNKTSLGVWLNTESGGDVHVHTERERVVIGLNKTRNTPTPQIAIGISEAGTFIQICHSGDPRTAKQIKVPAAVIAGWLLELAGKAEGYAAACTQPDRLGDEYASAVGVIVAPPVA